MNMKSTRTGVLAVFIGVGGWADVASAVTVPFTEEFVSDAANWRDATSINDLTWSAAGGPDGGSYASTLFNFVDSTDVDTPALFRGQTSFNSSDGAFAGNWVSAGVSGLSAMVRHDAGVPVTFFARFAGPANFPGAASVIMTPVLSGQWTQINIPLPDPNAVFEGPFSFEDVFANVGNVQIGIAVPPSLVGVDQAFTFDIDKVAIVPEPASLLLLTLGATVMGWLAPRRRGGCKPR